MDMPQQIQNGSTQENPRSNELFEAMVEILVSIASNNNKRATDLDQLSPATFEEAKLLINFSSCAAHRQTTTDEAFLAHPSLKRKASEQTEGAIKCARIDNTNSLPLVAVKKEESDSESEIEEPNLVVDLDEEVPKKARQFRKVIEIISLKCVAGCNKFFSNAEVMRHHLKDTHGLEKHRCLAIGCEGISFHSQ